MRSFAIYRLPYAKECTKMVQQTAPLEVASLQDLNGKTGFVIAPFMPSVQCPILLLQPEEVVTLAVKQPETILKKEVKPTERKEYRDDYHKDFAVFHEQICNGRFSKIVLSRCVEEEKSSNLQAEEIFWRACQRYPRQFVALFSTPQTGTWLMATPEILLDGNSSNWKTMALAGTMPYQSDEIIWSEKNKAEQQYVAKYIRQCLEQHATDIEEQGAYTAQAADLAHLRTDFKFQLKDNTQIGTLLDQLHPTPAVCGIEKEIARKFILDNETTPRRYYSGFAGALNLNGNTHLYVSLRCMEIMETKCRLYAGGGLLTDSTEESEWQETEAKLATMRQLLE